MLCLEKTLHFGTGTLSVKQDSFSRAFEGVFGPLFVASWLVVLGGAMNSVLYKQILKKNGWKSFCEHNLIRKVLT